jgi:hypothetical protein
VETVYIVITISVVVVALVTVILLRDRITKAKFGASMKNGQITGEVEAGEPKGTAGESASPQATTRRTPRRGFIGNIARWWSRIRIRAQGQKGVLAENNVASFGSEIDIEVTSPEQPRAND